MLEGKGLWDKRGLFVVFLENTFSSLHNSVTFLQGLWLCFHAVVRLFFPLTFHIDCLIDRMTRVHFWAWFFYILLHSFLFLGILDVRKKPARREASTGFIKTSQRMSVSWILRQNSQADFVNILLRASVYAARIWWWNWFRKYVSSW